MNNKILGTLAAAAVVGLMASPALANKDAKKGAKTAKAAGKCEMAADKHCCMKANKCHKCDTEAGCGELGGTWKAE